MGLFDRLKKAFKHDKTQEEKPAEEVAQVSDTEEANSEIDQTANEQAVVEESSEREANSDQTEVDTFAEDGIASEAADEFENPEQESTVEVTDLATDDTDESEDDVISEETEANVAQVEETIEPEIVSSDEETQHSEDKVAIIEDDVPNTESLEATTVEEIEDVAEQTADKTSDEETTDDDLIQDKPEAEKYDKGLAKTRKTFGERLNELFANFRHIDEDFFDELEEALIMSDVGLETSLQLIEELKQEVKLKNVKKPRDVQNTVIEKLVEIYEMDDSVEARQHLNLQTEGTTVILFVGVNGAGKTTTIGKMAHQFKEEGKKVILAAADTFRAGAINQLIKWGERSEVEVVAGQEGGDPAAVVYDAVQQAKKEQADILLVDTAGRLQNKEHLMRELNKIKRVIQKELPEAPHEVLLVIDATTGQNALVQAQKFNETTDVTGIVLTKLDGTAKGGIVLAIRNELKIPVKYVGLGEKMDDLAPFDSEQFIYGLFKDLWIEDEKGE